MDIGPTHIWVKNPLWHDSAGPHGLSEKSNPIQKQRIQHGLIARHDAWIGGKMQENVGEKNNESEQNGKKRKRRVAGSLMGQVKG